MQMPSLPPTRRGRIVLGAAALGLAAVAAAGGTGGATGTFAGHSWSGSSVDGHGWADGYPWDATDGNPWHGRVVAATDGHIWSGSSPDGHDWGD